MLVNGLTEPVYNPFEARPQTGPDPVFKLCETEREFVAGLCEAGRDA